jgi:HAD superfamily hydrolase (TIGR01509 family)
MDGVIINSHPAHRRAWQEFLRMFGKHVSEGDLDFILEGRKRQDILRHFLGNISERELLEYGRKKDELFQKISEEVLPISGIVEFLQELHQLEIPAAVATSASNRRTSLTLKRLNLARHFRVVVTGDDVAEGKPNPDIYKLAAQRLQLPAEDLLALEDAPGGVAAAISAKMRCIGVASDSKAHALREAGAQHVIPDFVEFSFSRLQQILSAPTLLPGNGRPHHDPSSLVS